MPHPKKTAPLSTQSRVGQVRFLLRSGEGARALPLVGDRWVLLILRDAFLGARRFEDFRRLTGAARGTLTDRLNALVDDSVLYRNPYRKAPIRLEYRLTEKGMGFYPIALALWSWESRWAGEFGLPPRLVHKSCGKVMHPQLCCAHCGKALDARDLAYEPGPGAKIYAVQQRQERRRRESPARALAGVDTTMFHSIDTLGDRWTVLLLATLFFGLHRYDDIFKAMGIATNILADRLRRLLAAGVVEQHLYQDRPPRYEYRLTAKGWDLYPATIAIHDWAATWVPSPSGPALKLRHKPCGHAWRGRMSCDQCHGAIDPHEVGLKPSANWRASRGNIKHRSA
jgi:DNA-binding HxlR family transcriptional regulator